MEIFGIRLVGANPETLRKLLLTFLFVAAILIIRAMLRYGIRFLTRSYRNERVLFWTRQVFSLWAAIFIVLAVLSIWFDDPTRLATGLGLVTAGLAFALQKVVISFAGYLLIMRGRTFTVGDRITMGGVRGDVIALGFIQTTIMEMGEPQSVKSPEISWVNSRQYTGRVVSITNDKVFAEPIFNYTREFPFLWEELRIPIKYDADRKKAEQILLECVDQVTSDSREISKPLQESLERRYFLRIGDATPRVYYNITDNWLELSVRFIVKTHGIRDTKDAISRRVLDLFEKAGIKIASATVDVVGLPMINANVGQDK